MTERHETFEAYVDWLDGLGDLDRDGMTDRLLLLHDDLRSKGANPDDPNTYRGVLAGLALAAQVQPPYGDYVLAEVATAAARALRDMKVRGQG